jgi:hypothetical protein
MNAVYEEPLFTSTHAALTFCLNFVEQQYERPMMNKLASPVVGGGKGLAGLDGAAQAGMIRSNLRRLTRVEECALIARCAPPTLPCHCGHVCCGGEKPHREWTDAIGELARDLKRSVFDDREVNIMLRRAYVLRYFTRKKDREAIETVAARFDIVRNTFSAHYSRVKVYLQKIEDRGFDVLDERFRETGVVGDP